MPRNGGSIKRKPPNSNYIRDYIHGLLCNYNLGLVSVAVDNVQHYERTDEAQNLHAILLRLTKTINHTS